MLALQLQFTFFSLLLFISLHIIVAAVINTYSTVSNTYQCTVSSFNELYISSYPPPLPQPHQRTNRVINSFRSEQFVKLPFMFKMRVFYIFHAKFGRAMSDFKHGHWAPSFKGPADKE